MKIQSKSTMQSQPPAKSEDNAAAQTAGTTDFFASLLASMGMPAAAADSESEPDSSSQASSDTQPAEAPQPENPFSVYYDLAKPLPENTDKLLTAENKGISTKYDLPIMPATVNSMPGQAATEQNPSQQQMETKMDPVMHADLSASSRDELLQSLRAFDKMNGNHRDTPDEMPPVSDAAGQAVKTELKLPAAPVAADRQQATAPTPSAQDLTRQQDMNQLRADLFQQKYESKAAGEKDPTVQLSPGTVRDAAPRLQQPLTVFHLQRGQTVARDGTANNYVNTLIQLGNLIQGEAGAAKDAAKAPTPSSFTRTADSNFNELMNKTAFPGYELKIDLLPVAAGSNITQAYQASIKIHPPELGSVVAKLSMNKKDASLVIVAESHQVKAVIEKNLPQLRHQFHQADINLTNIQIEVQNSRSESQDRQRQSQQSEQLQEYNERTENQKKAENSSEPPRQRSDSIIDTYA